MEEIQQKDTIYTLIKSYYTKMDHNRKTFKTPLVCPKKEEIEIINIYTTNTIFTSDVNIVKEMMVIHYRVKNRKGIVRLSINLENYNL